MRHKIYILLAVLVGLTFLVLLDQKLRSELRLENERQLSEVATSIERELTYTLQGLIKALSNLEAFMLAGDTLPNTEAFDRFSARLTGQHEALDMLVYVGPDRVIRHIFPLEPHQSAVGLDLTTRPSAAYVEKAIKERRMVVDDPHRLVNGQLAIVARAPLYRGDEFLGLAQGIFDIGDIVSQCLTPWAGEYDFHLHDQNGSRFWGPPALQGAEQHRIIAVGDNTWRLTIGGELALSGPVRVALALIWWIGGALLVLLTIQLSRRLGHTDELNRAVEQKTRELAESEERYRALMENASDGILVADDIGRFIDANHNAASMLGYTREELLKIGPRDVHPPERQANVEASFRDMNAMGHSLYEQQLLTKQGNRIPVEVAGTRIPYRETHLYMAVMRDIAERKRTEEALRRKSEELEAIFASMYIHLAVLDREFRYVRANDAYASTVSCPSDALIGRSLFDFTPPEINSYFHEVMATGETFSLTGTPYNQPERGMTYWDLTVAPLRDARGHVEGIVLAAIDATEREQQRQEAEEAYRRANEQLERRVHERTLELEASNKELETFSYSVSHDLRAPLRAINGFSQALSEDCPGALDELGRSYLNQIRKATLRMSDLIDGLLNLAKVFRSEPKQVEIDLNTLAHQVADLLQAAEPQREVRLRIDERMETVGDPVLLRLLIQNLLGNAWKFTAEQAAPEIAFGKTRVEGCEVFYVSDNGVGFDMRYAHKLFQPFERLHTEGAHEGTGIGLATVRRIVQRHGGSVWAEGEPGRGATIYFTLGGSPDDIPAIHAADRAKGTDDNSFNSLSGKGRKHAKIDASGVDR